MPWEKYRLSHVTKNMKAKIYLEYAGSGALPVPYETEINLPVSYDSIMKTLNYGVIAIGLLLFLLISFFFLWKKEDRRVDRLEEELAFVETEIDELERARLLAKDAIAKKKKSPKKTISKPQVEPVDDVKTPKKRTVAARKKKPDTPSKA
jgi:hypothetical protein